MRAQDLQLSLGSGKIARHLRQVIGNRVGSMRIARQRGIRVVGIASGLFAE